MSNPDPSPARHSESSRFATTRWTMVLAAGGDGPGREAAMERLCQVYWKPVYAFIRRHGRSPEDSADLTQSFFARVIERGTFSGLEREGARFSTFLLTVLGNFLKNQHARDSAQKRGGGAHAFTFDDARDCADPGLSPQQAFEHNWAVSVMEAAMDALRRECDTAGKSELFASLAPFLSRDAAHGEYEALGATTGMRPGTIAVSVHRLRLRFRERLRAALAEGGDPDEELRFLRQALAYGN